MGIDYLLRRRGPLTMAPSQLGIFTRSDPHQERANIQSPELSADLGQPDGWLLRYTVVRVLIAGFTSRS